ncbi:MAG: hypothetical protein GX878_06685 [Firmicutes bacterium]|nr:hypothetical protein [Bacillota bacterium]
MQRLLLLVSFSFIFLLFCFVTPVIEKDNLREEYEEPLSHSRNDYVQPFEKRAAYLKKHGISSRTSGKEPAPKAASPNDGKVGCNEDKLTEKQDPTKKGSPAKRVPAKPLPDETEESIHFLLIGRWWNEPATEMLMVVTLVPGRCARLLSLDPAARVEYEGNNCPIGELLERGCRSDSLCSAVNFLTGLKPQFFIDLNLLGFVEMIDLLQKDSSKIKPLPETLVNGNEMLLSLNDTSMSHAAREEMVVQLLISASEIQFTRLGWKLLWIGYRNLKTDLSLEDLLEIRKITQKIAPKDVILMEGTP